MKLRFLIFAVLLSAALLQLHAFPASPEAVQDDEPLLKFNIPYQFTYTLPESGFMNMLQDPDEISLLIYTDLLSDPKEIRLQKQDSRWHGAWVLTDTSVKMLMYAFKATGASYVRSEELIDNNFGKYYDLLVHDETEVPIRGAYQARAVSWTGFGNRRKERLREAAEDVKMELERYPDNFSARLLLYTIGLRQKEYDAYTRERIEDDIEKTLSSYDGGEDLYKFAAAAYRLIGDQQKAGGFDQKLIALNPKGDQAAGKAFEKIMDMKDSQKQWDALEGFITVYPSSRYSEFALSTMISLAIDRDDSTAFIRLGDRALKEGATPASASALAGLAGTLSEKGIELNRASAYVTRALDLIRNTDSDLKPPSISEQGWQNQIKSTAARYHDILGWIYYQQGDLDASLDELRVAAESAHQPGTLLHLAQALQDKGRTDESLMYFARAAVYGGDIGDMAYAAFESLWKQSGKPESAIQNYLETEQAWLANDYQKRVLALRSVQKAPDFELEAVSGGWVRLTDQRGTVVLLCFWASWSESSLRMLVDLKRLADEYGQDVLFLTVATNKDVNAVKSFIDKHDINFPVLLNDTTDKDYKLQGVPTLFVLDSRGRIHFEHRGHRPDLLDQLMVELDDLL